MASSFSSLDVQKLKFTESDRLLVQIQAYLDNVFDVGALLEDAETKNALLEHMEELQEHNTLVDALTHTHVCTVCMKGITAHRLVSTCMSQLSSRLQESEREAVQKASEMEKKLIETTKAVELLKVEAPRCSFYFPGSRFHFQIFSHLQRSYPWWGLRPPAPPPGGQ